MRNSVKPVEFRGGALADLRAFPADARREAGYQLDRVQHGSDPDDWKPMKTIGPGVREIRIRGEDGAYRVIYVANFPEAVFVLHCFQKKISANEPRGSCAGRKPLQGTGERVKVMTKRRFASVWDAIEDSAAEAENMKLRSRLMMAVRDHIEREGLSQAQAAKLFGVTQPRVSDLVRGKIDLFSIDTLVNMLAAAGLRVDLRIARTR